MTAASVNDVVEKIGRQCLVENIIRKYSNTIDGIYGDLSQDIYMSLLADNKIVDIYNKGQINYYVARIVKNNICSSTSRFYRKYIYPDKQTDDIYDYTSRIEENND